MLYFLPEGICSILSWVGMTSQDTRQKAAGQKLKKLGLTELERQEWWSLTDA